jgi:hypothetical protein
MRRADRAGAHFGEEIAKCLAHYSSGSLVTRRHLLQVECNYRLYQIFHSAASAANLQQTLSPQL